MKSKALFLLAGVLLILSGCKANQESLENYLIQVDNQTRREVAKLAPVVQFQIFPYTQHRQREPFVLPQEALVNNQSSAKSDCWQPTPRARNGALERFPLSALSLKGVMSSGGTVSALVQTPSGSVSKVKAGEFVGLNNGQIIRVSDTYLLIKETLPDGLGCWNQRNVKLALK